MIRKLLPVLTLALFASPVFAELDVDAVKEKACASKECCSKGCPIQAAMAELPQVTYLVGSEEICCPDAAAKLAESKDATVTYVVAKQSFDEQPAAMLALAEATEKFVSEFAEPSQCEKSGKITVAGKELCCEAMAGERAEVAKKAMQQVELTYLVGDHECDCPAEAAKLAKESGQEKVFLIDNQKTCCSVDARVKLARAKFRAAVEALAKVDAAQPSDDS